MRSKTILVFGCGWLGLPLAKTLAIKNYNVIGTTTSDSKLDSIKAAGAIPIQTQVGDPFFKEKIAAYAPQILIISYPLRTRKISIMECDDHAEWIAAQFNFNNLQQVILTSSTSVYCDSNTETTEESTCQESGNGFIQLAFERKLKAIFGAKLITLRLAGLIAEDRHPGNFLADKLNVPNGDAPVNLVHRMDIIAFIHAVIETQTINEVFNICADDHPTKQEYYTKMALQIGKNPPQFNLDKTTITKQISNQKSKDLLGFTYKKSIYLT